MHTLQRANEVTAAATVLSSSELGYKLAKIRRNFEEEEVKEGGGEPLSSNARPNSHTRVHGVHMYILH